MAELFERPTVLLVVVVGLVVLFGSKRLPDAARGVGRSLRILNAETQGLASDDASPPAVLADPGGQAASELPADH